MKPVHRAAALLLCLAAAPALTADEPAEGFVPLFNGKDLSGWVNVNCAPGTFHVRDGEIVTTGKPTGYLRTARQYENFIAEFDWMHVPPRPGAGRTPRPQGPCRYSWGKNSSPSLPSRRPTC